MPVMARRISSWARRRAPRELTCLPTPVFCLAAAAGFPRFGLVDRQRSAVEVAAIEGVYGLLTLSVIRHFDKGEASGLSRVAICYDIHTVYRAVPIEQGSNGILGAIKAQVSYKNIFQTSFFFLEMQNSESKGQAKWVITGE